jgi:hypothetical protein
MTKDEITTLLERAETWPQAAQEQLVRSAIDIEKKYIGVYALSADERKDIREGMKEIQNGEVADEQETRSTFEDLHRT